MGRKVTGPKPGGSRYFVPASFENRKDPEPIRVEIKDPTEAEKRTLTLLQTELGFANGEIARDANGAPQINVTLEAMANFQKQAVLAHVVSVENYEVREIEIVDGATLAEHGETEILAEVALEITTGMSLGEHEKKQSSALSTSKTQKKKASNGIAKNARSKASTKREIATGELTGASFT